ncbi:MAG: hypothetical protein ACREYC_27610, partial [Gammaproteobacteria bacterium]
FYRHLSPALIPNAHDRADIIGSVITHADPDNPLDDQLVLELFGRPKRIAEVLHRDKAAIAAWISDIVSNCIDKMPSQWQKHAYTCLGQIERNNLTDFEAADRFFEAAISCDRRFGFAYRQRSWNLLHAGKLPEAEKSALRTSPRGTRPTKREQPPGESETAPRRGWQVDPRSPQASALTPTSPRLPPKKKANREWLALG